MNPFDDTLQEWFFITDLEMILIDLEIDYDSAFMSLEI